MTSVRAQVRLDSGANATSSPVSYWAHPTAIIDEPAAVGDGTKIWHFCHLMTGARVGRDCSLGQNVFVGGAAVVGDRCKIQNNVSVYDAVEIADDVFVGPSAVFTNVVNPRAFVERKTEYLPTRVGRGASVGANATVLCGCTIGEYALVGAGAVVTKDVPPHAVVVGVPARVAGWVCRCGESLREGREPVCEACGTRYAPSLDAAGLRLHPDQPPRDR